MSHRTARLDRRSLVVAALAASILLAGCAPAAPTLGDTATQPPRVPPASDAIEPLPTAEPAGGEGDTDGGASGDGSSSGGVSRMPDRERSAIREGLAAHMADDIAGRFGPGLIDYILASTDCCGAMTPIEAARKAVADTSYITDWAYDVPPEALAAMRASHSYGRYLTDDLIVMKGSDTTVVIFALEGENVSAILVGTEEHLQW